MNRNALISTLVIAVVAAVTYLLLPAGYGKVSPRTYEFAKALYSACLSKSEARIAQVETMLRDELETDSKVPENQADWLEGIVETARQGNWESAAKQARRMMEDQVEY